MNQQRPLRILQCVAPSRAGGLDRVVEALSVGHHRQGHDVTVAAVLLDGRPTHPFAEGLAGEGVPVRTVPIEPRAYFAERRAIAEICRDVRPDVVHTHGYRLDVVDRSVAARQGIPTVTTLHGYDRAGGLKGMVYEWLQQRNARRFDAVVAVSRTLSDIAEAAGVSPQRIHLIPNAWSGLREPLPREDARRALELDGNRPVLGWVGRMLPVKGGDVLLHALAELPEPRPLVAMIGDGPDAAPLAEQARRLGLDDDVRFYPNIDDAGRLFTAFDTFVLSSRSEGLPIVVLEAMAARAPIVATRVGGVPDMLGGDDAWLAPPEDPSALATAIEASLADRTEAERRASNAAKRLDEDFALEPWLARYEAVYRTVSR